MKDPVRVLFVCTGNSARSQLAEAILNWKGKGRFTASSAGSHPAERVNPYAIRELEDRGIPWSGSVPRGLGEVEKQPWDLVITVCDRAKESCPVFSAHPTMAHWGLPDPAEVNGDESAKRAAFRDTFVAISRRIDLLIALP